MPIRVILADDHTIVREGLRAILASEKDVEIIGEASNGSDTVKLARKIEPDVIVMDVSMPDLNGIDATQRILDLGLSCKILALSGHAEENFVKGMLKAGASGYLLKECAGEELALALHKVSLGHVYVSPGIAGIIMNDYVAHLTGDVTAEAPTLSSREREVVQLIAEGRSTAKIAEHLNLSVKTVESHRKRIMDKLKINNIAGLTKYAIREGITSIEK